MPLVLTVQRRQALLDVPRHRSSHTVHVPRGAGIARLVGLATAALTHHHRLQMEVSRPLSNMVTIAGPALVLTLFAATQRNVDRAEAVDLHTMAANEICKRYTLDKHRVPLEAQSTNARLSRTSVYQDHFDRPVKAFASNTHRRPVWAGQL